MSRSVPLWVGKTDDTAAPPRVRARVYEREQGLCHRCRRKIGPADRWTLEHVIALALGGANSEANLACTCDWCLPIKNAEDVALKAKGAAIRARHYGIKDHSKYRWGKQRLGSGNHQHTATSPIVRKAERAPIEE